MLYRKAAEFAGTHFECARIAAIELGDGSDIQGVWPLKKGYSAREILLAYLFVFQRSPVLRNQITDEKDLKLFWQPTFGIGRKLHNSHGDRIYEVD
jgi:hypothetical protein